MKLSIVVPIYNEEDVLPQLLQRIERVTSSVEADWEWLFVNDGSCDRSLEILVDASRRHCEIRVLSLSRNFGQQAAITAGLAEAGGDAVILMDGDLQDPPELVTEMVDAWRAGYQVVVAARRSRAEHGWRRLAFDSFHQLFDWLSDYPVPRGAGMFSLLDRRAVDELIRLPERSRFFPGLREWVGLSRATVWYDREERAAGKPKQTFGRLFKYAFDAIFSFSYKPLRVIWLLGTLMSVTCFIYGILLVTLRVLQINVVPGFTTPTVLILFLGGIQLISVGILGEYIGRVYDEVKQRPMYIVDQEFQTGCVVDHSAGILTADRLTVSR